jgi:hypothetical protein
MTVGSVVALWRLACLFSRESNEFICPHAAEFGRPFSREDVCARMAMGSSCVGQTMPYSRACSRPIMQPKSTADDNISTVLKDEDPVLVSMACTPSLIRHLFRHRRGPDSRKCRLSPREDRTPTDSEASAAEKPFLNRVGPSPTQVYNEGRFAALGTGCCLVHQTALLRFRRGTGIDRQ